jgi:hypothetical protein
MGGHTAHAATFALTLRTCTANPWHREGRSALCLSFVHGVGAPFSGVGVLLEVPFLSEYRLLVNTPTKQRASDSLGPPTIVTAVRAKRCANIHTLLPFNALHDCGQRARKGRGFTRHSSSRVCITTPTCSRLRMAGCGPVHSAVLCCRACMRACGEVWHVLLPSHASQSAA